jgi:hypothetical protein
VCVAFHWKSNFGDRLDAFLWRRIMGPDLTLVWMRSRGGSTEVPDLTLG